MQTLQPTVFFGSGPVAAASLKALMPWQPISAVVTKQTPPHHKEAAPVEAYAIQNNLPLLYADTKKQLEALVLPDCAYGIVIDYGVIISDSVINHFPLGIINSHFSLLPEWRGADPITYALLSGQKITGVSLMRIDAGLDTGPLIAIKEVTLTSGDTNQSLTAKLIAASNDLLEDSLPLYAAGKLSVYNQPSDAIVTHSQKFTKQSGVLDPSKTAPELERQIRAFSGWPGSRLQYKDVWLTIISADASPYNAPVGTLVVHDKSLYYGCKNGSLCINDVQPAGKKIMSASAFINGYAQKLFIPVVS
jgi:methionyl-tRNA formyltransferase